MACLKKTQRDVYKIPTQAKLCHKILRLKIVTFVMMVVVVEVVMVVVVVVAVVVVVIVEVVL